MKFVLNGGLIIGTCDGANVSTWKRGETARKHGELTRLD